MARWPLRGAVPSGARETRYPGYWATLEGEIYSTVTGRILRPGMGTNGRYGVAMPVKSGRFVRKEIHRLVCQAFHGDPPFCEGRMTASHINGDKLDNRPENLCWESMTENHRRKIVHGTDDRGVKNSRACLDVEQVVLIRKLRESGITHKEIAENMGVSRTTISRVLNGLRYQEVV